MDRVGMSLSGRRLPGDQLMAARLSNGTGNVTLLNDLQAATRYVSTMNMQLRHSALCFGYISYVPACRYIISSVLHKYLCLQGKVPNGK